MPYTIECEGSFSSANATESDINHAFDHDAERGDFIILTAPNGDFIQAAGAGNGPFLLEHRNAGTKEHTHAISHPDKEQTRQTFLGFFRGDPAWKGDRMWEPLKSRSGCVKLPVLLIVAAAVLVYAFA